MSKHTPVIDRAHPSMGGSQKIYRFANGYGASVINTPSSYGLELGVIKFTGEDGWDLTYATSITNDVLGHLTPTSLEQALDDIAALKLSARTPGPWEVEASTNEIVNADHGRLLFVIRAGYTLIGALYENEADARLIAAAPDLLAALHAARSVIVFQRDVIEGGKNAKSWSGPLEAIDAAITKAEGAEP